MERLIPKTLMLAWCLLFSAASNSQTLNLPARSVSALTGSQVVSAITSLDLQTRELAILEEVLTGNVPDFYRTMVLINDSAWISGAYQYIDYYVIPDYLALGSNSDYFLCPMTPILAQRIADSLDCILPTRKMVNTIWQQADYKMNPESIPPSGAMITLPVFDDHNDMVWTQRQPQLVTYPLGSLVSGNKKDVIISNLIYTSPSPARVVIYGWHYNNGTNIQPMYAGHIDTYADYSHGIRLVQNGMWLNGIPTIGSDVLTSPTNNSLLSDEGVLAQPYYPDTTTTTIIPAPAVPKSFAVMPTGATSALLTIAPDANVTNYIYYTSSDGVSFSNATSFTGNSTALTGLTGTTYVRIEAENTGGLSGVSEVLTVYSTGSTTDILIVNGFDRATTNNSKNFCRQHAAAIELYGKGFASATNDALLNGLLSVNSYPITVLILGEESTVDETFSTAEQGLYATYLDQGGKLMVSGAEIGWDLQQQGSAADEIFYNNYLKANYIFDAPNNESNTYFDISTTSDTLFENLGVVSFDNGTQGTYNVSYPDVLTPINGSAACLHYDGFPNDYAGVYYQGFFPNGTTTGKLVHLGVPFETIYPSNARNYLMQRTLDFFYATPITVDVRTISEHEVKAFPNPFSNHIRVTGFEGEFTYSLVSITGQLLASGISRDVIHISGSINTGSYILEITHKKGVHVQKLLKQ